MKTSFILPLSCDTGGVLQLVKLLGVPVFFIPGNGGSYKQVAHRYQFLHKFKPKEECFSAW